MVWPRYLVEDCDVARSCHFDRIWRRWLLHRANEFYTGQGDMPSMTISVRKQLLAVGVVLAALFFGLPARADAPPTPEEYVAYVGPHARIVAPGEFVLDNKRQICGKRPVVLDEQLDDYGAAYPGFLIMNPKLLARVSTPVKFWIFAHECAHQFRGPDEETADCFAVQRGRRQGWLTEKGLDQVCNFIKPAKGDMMHFSGSHRCEAMRRCYTDKRVR